MLANLDIDVFTIAREILCKIARAPNDVSYNAGRASADVIIYRRRPAPVRYVTTQEKSSKSSGARAIIKFAGGVHIAKIVRCQVCDHSSTRVFYQCPHLLSALGPYRIVM